MSARLIFIPKIMQSKADKAFSSLCASGCLSGGRDVCWAEQL